MAESDKGLPQVGMIFKSKEEAWIFWVAYGGRAGFEVRKRYTNVNKSDGTVTSCRYVCAKEGVRRKGQSEFIQKCFRPETRTKCNAHMTITFHRSSGIFEVTDVVHSMAYKVASSMECCLLLENALDSVGPKLEEKLNASTSVMNEPSNDKENASPNVQQTDDLLRAAQLKKKEVQSKGLKRKKTWLDKLCKGKRKATKPVSSTKKGAKQHKRKDDVQPQVEVKDDGHKKEANVESGKYNVIETFTQLLTAPPTCVGDSFYGGILF